MKMKLYSTLWQNEKIHQTESDVVLTDESAEARAVEMQVVNVYPQVTYQTIVGFWWRNDGGRRLFAGTAFRGRS